MKGRLTLRVNHLCFTAQDFLRLVGECETDEFVYYQTKWDKFWKGTLMAEGFRVICLVKKDREITEIMEIFH